MMIQVTILLYGCAKGLLLGASFNGAIQLPDVNIDAGFGGPVPFISDSSATSGFTFQQGKNRICICMK